MLIVILRIIHIAAGVFWAGTVFFVVSFLIPTVADLGPDGGKVMAALTKRGLPTKLPVVAMVTIVSGAWLYYLLSGGQPSWFQSRQALLLGIGGISALVALSLGFIIAKPTIEKMGALHPKLAAAPAGVEKDAMMEEMGRLRAKNVMGLRLVAMLLGITVIAMAIARYV